MTDRSAVRICIVGTARHTWHRSDEPSPEPLAMWEQVARQAIDDIGTSADVARELDHLGVVHTQSWNYDDPVGRLRGRLGSHAPSGEYSIIAGTSPQRMIDQAASAMVRGEIESALIVGAEAQATLRRLEAAGEIPDWSHPDPSPQRIEEMFADWYLPTEINHGVLPAWMTFALLSQARWAALDARPQDRHAMFEQLAALSSIAAGSEHAWNPTAHSAERLATPTPDNRPIATPFTKLTTAFPFVDMAAANVVVTDATADRWGVPEDRRVYLRGWGFARDASHLAAREDLTGSPAMRIAMADALSMASMDTAEIDVFDLYSCFGSAVQFARDALEIPDDDIRPVSLTGGLPFHGGPGSNYMNHSISALVDDLRADPGRTGMVTGIGMHMMKHVVGIWSSAPGSTPLSSESRPLALVPDEEPTARKVLDVVDSSVTIDAACALFDRDAIASSVIAVCSLDDGSRCYARSDDADVIDAVVADEWVGVRASVHPIADGTNRLVI